MDVELEPGPRLPGQVRRPEAEADVAIAAPPPRMTCLASLAGRPQSAGASFAGGPPYWVSLSAPIWLPICWKRAISASRSAMVEAWLGLLAHSIMSEVRVVPKAITQIE